MEETLTQDEVLAIRQFNEFAPELVSAKVWEVTVNGPPTAPKARTGSRALNSRVIAFPLVLRARLRDGSLLTLFKHPVDDYVCKSVGNLPGIH